MNLLNVNRLAGEVVHRGNFGFQATDPEYHKREFCSVKRQRSCCAGDGIGRRRSY